jgi:hypothetical protein
MELVAFVLERERRIGEKQGIEKERYERNFAFMSRLLKETDFDDAKIAELASVPLEFVKNRTPTKRMRRILK